MAPGFRYISLITASLLVFTGTLNAVSFNISERLGGNSPTFLWHQSLPVQSFSPSVNPIGGTEARVLTSMNHRLYAGIGYWKDTELNNPQLPGAQVLRLDSPGSPWQVDLQLDERMTGEGPRRSGRKRYLAISVMKTVRFDSDLNGRPLTQPVEILLAGVWDLLGKLEVFSKESNVGRWAMTPLGNYGGRFAEIRSFGSHRDQVTNIQRAFAGSRIKGLPVEPAIYSGVYDPSMPGGIRWDETPEAWQGDPSLRVTTTRGSQRVTGMAECNGRLYASVYNTIYERQDGLQASWKPIWNYVPKTPFGEGSSGLRGLTAIPNPAGAGEVLLVTLEHNPCFLFSINPQTGKGVVEANISEQLSELLGTKVGFIIAGYNNMVLYETAGRSRTPTVLMGIESATPMVPSAQGAMNSDARLLIRWPNGRLSFEEIVDRTLTPRPMLVSARSVIISPFAEDPPGTVYASGYDCNNKPAHNTDWIYRGTPLRE
jgi:poly(A) polymerase